VLVRAFLAEQRTAWSKRVTVTHQVPDDVAVSVDLEAQMDLRAALAVLAPRQRAAVVLRYYCDLSVDQIAYILRFSAGTVKSQTARGLETSASSASATPPSWAAATRRP
jgi:RNA polymerase sigma factor (sigma-70 family)